MMVVAAHGHIAGLACHVSVACTSMGRGPGLGSIDMVMLLKMWGQLPACAAHAPQLRPGGLLAHTARGPG